VPEVNAHTLADHQGIIADPNCVAIIAAVPLAPLHAANRIRRVIAATYQAASGAGAAAMEELRASTEAHLAGRVYPPRVLKHPYAFNLFSHDAEVDVETGEDGEETKVVRELRRMHGGTGPAHRHYLRARPPRAGPTRWPSPWSSTRPMTPDEARAILAAAPGVPVYQMIGPGTTSPCRARRRGRVTCWPGALREDGSDPSGRSISLMLAGDQLLKGAALNAVQIAERLLERDRLRP
jgi:aspartate-semialdehyde dehydrogenase